MPSALCCVTRYINKGEEPKVLLIHTQTVVAAIKRMIKKRITKRKEKKENYMFSVRVPKTKSELEPVGLLDFKT